jgi:hypothetical protein
MAGVLVKLQVHASALVKLVNLLLLVNAPLLGAVHRPVAAAATG